LCATNTCPSRTRSTSSQTSRNGALSHTISHEMFVSRVMNGGMERSGLTSVS
jgi:hypothetical protein